MYGSISIAKMYLKMVNSTQSTACVFLYYDR